MFRPRHPLGVSRTPAGLRFALFAPAEAPATLTLFEPGSARPFSEHVLEAELVDEDGIRELELHGLPRGFEYEWRIGGGPALVDPYARLISGGESWGRSDDLRGEGVGRRHRALYIEEPFDWQEVERPDEPSAGRVILELHVRGFTRHPSSGVRNPGTYLGVAEKIPELVELGVTAVELMPVFEFDETENSRRDPSTGERLLNLWGYSPISFFAPKAGYASDAAPGAAARELKTLVRELHRAGLEVILDVVYNHTAEGAGGEGDPLLSWRGFADEVYYLHDAKRNRPLDVTGCGNTVNLNHPVVRRMVLDSLRHWSRDYRVDGFRFDLAAVLYRGEHGEPMDSSPLVEEISSDPELSQRLLIAEPWDATGFSPASGFPAPWLVWDGEHRDELRLFVGRKAADPSALPRRLAGRGALRGSVPAERTVRYVACHDGRPLADVVAYAEKHNHANGEGNRDGWDGEVAWNGGVEGATDDPDLREGREREIRLLLALLALSPGTLQITAGDELGRTQRGNTNAWCQDNELGWVAWPAGGDSGRDGEGVLRALVRRLLLLRKGMESWRAPARWARVESIRASEPARSGADAADDEPCDSFLLYLEAANEEARLVGANAGRVDRRFPIPAPPAGRRWRLVLDTGRGAGAEVPQGSEAPFLAPGTSELEVAAGSVRLLVAEV